jgi:hypothetical protein
MFNTVESFKLIILHSLGSGSNGLILPVLSVREADVPYVFEGITPLHILKML